MLRIGQGLRLRSLPGQNLAATVVPTSRYIRTRAYGAELDQEALEEARKWHSNFNDNQLPRGQQSYSRSSGPGGQHVNKTETKATTVWPVAELAAGLPKLLHTGLRESKYYAKGTDSITIQAQSQRSRVANAEENQQKLVQELERIYREKVPGVTSDAKAKKIKAMEKSSNEGRLEAKKRQSSKKASRRRSSAE